MAASSRQTAPQAPGPTIGRAHTARKTFRYQVYWCLMGSSLALGWQLQGYDMLPGLVLGATAFYLVATFINLRTDNALVWWCALPPASAAVLSVIPLSLLWAMLLNGLLSDGWVKGTGGAIGILLWNTLFALVIPVLICHGLWKTRALRAVGAYSEP